MSSQEMELSAKGRWRRRGCLVMLSAIALIPVLLFTLVSSVPSPPTPHSPGDVAIVGVSVVDVEAGVLLPGQTVLIQGGRIAVIDEEASAVVPEDVRRLDGSGRYLMPGLFDMHVHWLSSGAQNLSMPLFIANGVTAVRELGGWPSLEKKQAWGAAIDRGELLGPRILGATCAMVNRLSSVQEAQELVERCARDGGYLKVYNRLLPEHYSALLDAANSAGVEVIGHRPGAISLVEAAAAGQRSVEHARTLLYESFPGSEALRQRTLARLRGEEEREGRLVDTAMRRRMLDEHSPELLDQILGAMVEHEMWYVPTHLTRKMDAMADDEAYRGDDRLRYIHFAQKALWHDDANDMVGLDPSPEGRQAFMDFYLEGLKRTGEAHRAGVRILAGTDANDTYVFPGFSLHDELQELVKAGLTPAQALRAATLEPAHYFNRSADFGTVAVGKVADLVLLDADPLEEISNTTRIQAVIVGGAVYERSDLDALLAGVEEGASSFVLLASAMWQSLVD